MDDVVYFGDKRAGIWAYIPATFRKTKIQQVSNHDSWEWHTFLGESSIIRRMVPSEGAFSDAYSYLTAAEFPNPDDITAVLGRLVYVANKTLWFSDVGKPGSIVADNYILIPSENDVTAIQELQGNILIFTANELFFYRPSAGFLATNGTIQKVSNTIGCLNPNAVVVAEGSALWVDDTGVYSTSNGLNINKLSEGIETLWTKHISNPLTQYYQASGVIDSTDLARDNPSIVLQFNSEDVSVTFDHLRQNLVFSIPQEDFAMVLNNNGWGIWNFESVAAASGTIKATKNITRPFFVMGETNLYLIGSAETLTMDDQAQFTQTSPDVELNEDWATESFYILEYGKGGGLDRNIEYFAEDDRRVNGKYYNMTSVATGKVPTSRFNAVYIDPWIKVDRGYKLSDSISAPTDTDTYLLPFIAVPDRDFNWGGTIAYPPDQITIQFFFDNTHWIPIFTSGTATTVKAIFPAERLATDAGVTVTCRNGAGGAGARSGNFIDITMDADGLGHKYDPYFNLNNQYRNRLFWLPFTWAGDNPGAISVNSMGIEGYDINFTNTEGGTGNTYVDYAYFLVWQQAYINEDITSSGRHKAGQNDPAQPVDWVFKTDQVGLDDAAQSKARSLWLRIKSRGKGTTTNISSPTFGLLNGILASDWKGWTSQFIDYQGDEGASTPELLNKDIQKIEDKTSIRTRMYDSSTDALKKRTFNNAATWGDASDTSDGNYLIDDEEYDTICMSTSVKGEFFAWMLFGHINNEAEHLEVDSIKATLRPAGGRRRKGRG